MILITVIVDEGKLKNLMNLMGNSSSSVGDDDSLFKTDWSMPSVAKNKFSDRSAASVSINEKARDIK